MRDCPTFEYLCASCDPTVVETLDAFAGRRTVLPLAVALAVLLQAVGLLARAALLRRRVVGGLVDRDLADERVGVFLESVLDGLGAVVLVT